MANLISTAKENLAFLGVCAIVIVVVFLLSKLCQHFLAKDLSQTSPARKVANVAIFSAIGGVLMFFEIPLFFAPSFYEIDLSELPVLMCAFYMGPVAGVTAELLKILVKLLLKGTSTAFVGDLANFIIGCTFILPASIIYHVRRSKSSAITGMVVGTLCMTVFGSFFNAFYLIPTYVKLFGMPLEAIVGMGTEVNSHITDVTTLILFAVVPFNLLKGTIVSFLTAILYKRVEKFFFKNRPAKKKKA